ncbi:MAG TPA: beta-ketoacyl synthase N-terminal-like domain-containing protein [Verrucomicrobiae bacterium]|nr:beta-ketoacyl synthase N-terminal-like domain-containing protein [Verrucomicrobiae bacterium]
MSWIFIAGLGAVSPAGWTVAAMREALEQEKNFRPQPLSGSVGTSLFARLVPAPPARPEFLSHPRLRRTSPITHYAASAALEAMAGIPPARLENARIGLIVCVQSGCVQYSCRFYDETLKNPATASPLLFPETVHAAPASHIAVLLKNITLVTTQVGDPSCFLQATAQAAQWLEEKRVDFCLVIGAEEPNWITADAHRLFDRTTCLSAGAGAICLSREPNPSFGVELTGITDAHTYSYVKGRGRAALAMRNQLNGHSDNKEADLLCDGLGNSPQADRAELAAWRDWTGARLSPGRILGQGLMAGAAWQCVAACDALANRRFKTAKVSLVGFNQQAIGAEFQANDTSR